MEQDEIIARAVNIVKSNNRKLKIVLAILGKFNVVTDQKTFEVDNTERYTEDEIKEVFERKGYTNVRVIELDWMIPGYPYIDINNIPEASTLSSPGFGPGSTSSSTTAPSAPSSSASSSSTKMRYYTLGSNKGIFYIKEDSENPYVKDAFERLFTRRFSDLEISSFSVSERPTVDNKDYQSLSEFIANPKFKTRPPVNMNAFSDEDKTFYYKVETNHGIFLIRDESKEILESDEIKLILKRNFRDIQITSLKRSLGTPHTGYQDSDYQTLNEFFSNPKDISSNTSSSSDPLDQYFDVPATMEPPADPIRAAFSMGDLENLPEDDKRKILGHRTDYWIAHRYFRGKIKDLKITPSTTVSSLPVSVRSIGEKLINLMDDVEDGNVTQKDFISRVNDLDDTKDAIDRLQASGGNLSSAKDDLLKAFKGVFIPTFKKKTD